MEKISRTKIVDLLKRDDFGAMVNVKGWVRTRRGSKQVNFIALNDGSTINNVQIVVDVANFDEDVLKGFHCYDLDFTLAVGRKYTNYVCGGIAVEHLSSGNLDGCWYETTVQLHDTKWKPLLPVRTADVRWTEEERRRTSEDLSYRFLHNALRSSYSRKRDLLYAFWRRPFGWKHLGHCLSCTLKYLRVR